MFWGPGDRYTFLITGDETDGACFVMEALVPPGAGPPPHIHEREDETFYVLEGQCTIQIGQSMRIASAGDFVNIPKGTLHSFRNDGTAPARMILTFIPAGIEKYFEEVFTPVDDPSAAPPPPTPDLIARLLEAAPRYGVEFFLPEE